MSNRVRAAAIFLGFMASAGAVIWLSGAAIAEWQVTAHQLAEQRANAKVDLLVTVLNRNMRAVQTSFLTRYDRHESSTSLDLIAGALTSYAYPEAFFQWHATAGVSPMTFYVREERSPTWLPLNATTEAFPVVTGTEPVTAQRLLDRIARDAALERDYSIFDFEIADRPYQVVTLLSYADPFRDRLESVFGFMVNLDWVRAHYIQDLTDEVMRMGDALTQPQVIVSKIRHGEAREDNSLALAARRTFQLRFFDPRVIAVIVPTDLNSETFALEAVVSADPSLHAARVAARRTLIAVVISTVGLAVGFALTVRAEHRSAKLTGLRSEFVSSVTHELKTPIATIRAVSEIFAVGDHVTPELSRKHGRLALQEAKRLTRLIDNLLTFSRINDVTEAYAFEPVALEPIVNQTLEEFASQLEFGHFRVEVDVPAELPPVEADAQAIGMALGNLIDNAIRYSSDIRHLRVAARLSESMVTIEVQDRGIGISERELPQVTKKFFRGVRSRGGSGIGLAIVERIAADHRGSLEFRSTVGVGTTAILTLPVAVA